MKDGDRAFEEDDVNICLLDQTDFSDTHRREYYLMKILKMIAPFGLKTKETY